MFGKRLLVFYAYLAFAYGFELATVGSVILEGISLISSLCTIVGTLKSLGEQYARDQAGFKSLQDNVQKIAENLEGIEEKISYHTHILSRLYEVKIKAKRIDDLFDDVNDMIANNHSWSTQKQKATEILEINGVPALITELQGSLVGIGQEFNLVDLLFDHFEHVFLCKAVSKQRYLYELLRSHLETELKTFAIMRYAYNIRIIDENDPLVPEVTHFNNKYIERVQETLQVFKNLLTKSTRDVRRCDLIGKHVKGTTYMPIERAFSRIIYSADDIKRYFWKSECPSEYEESTRVVTPECYAKGRCSLYQRPCNRLKHCTYARPYTICLNNDQTQDQRYQFVENHILFLKRFEEPKVCNGVSKTYVHGSDRKIIIDASCLCVCDDEDSTSNRHFYLGNVVSDVKSNYVVTGVRFVQLRDTIFIEIQQGELLPLAMIDTDTLEWTTRDYSMPIQDIFNASYKHTLSWYDKRGIFLDIMDVPSFQRVITGVRFNLEEFDNQKVLKLEIQSTEYVENSGRLLSHTSQWHTTTHNPEDTKLFDLYEFDAPRNTGKEHKRDPAVTYVQFSPTNIQAKDAGTTLVPNLDMQTVETISPLVTIGLEYMGTTGSGGYIALMAKTYDVSMQL